MKTSPHGAPICTGAGVAAVRKRIEDAFASIRTNIDTNASGPELEVVEEIRPSQEPLLPLHDKAQPILRAAAHHHKGAATATHHNVVHRGAVHSISVPRKSAEQLFAEALQLLGRKR
jgi:hypothetical protein